MPLIGAAEGGRREVVQIGKVPKVIVAGLAVFYVMIAVRSFNPFLLQDPAAHAVILIMLFSYLAVLAVGLVRLKEENLRSFVVLNVLAAVYLIALETVSPGLVPWTLALPLAAAAVYGSLPQVHRRLQRGGGYPRKSVLVIDDDEGLVKTVKKILLSHGYSVLSALTGEKGLQVARRQRPDLIILDVILPGMKGREVCARLKDDPECRAIPVIFLTAKDSPDDVRAEIAAGALAHLTKPVNAKALLTEVRRALD